MRIAKSGTTVFTPLEDGGVLLNVDTLAYYKLNRTGTALWRDIEAGAGLEGLTLEQVVGRFCQIYDIDSDAATIDIRAFLEHLARFGMIAIS